MPIEQTRRRIGCAISRIGGSREGEIVAAIVASLSVGMGETERALRFDLRCDLGALLVVVVSGSEGIISGSFGVLFLRVCVILGF